MVIQRMAIWALNCEQNCNDHIWRKWPDAYFTIHVGRNHQQADTIPGSETGIDVTLGFGSYRVTDEIHSSVQSQDTLSQYSTDCSGVIHPDETKTRTITNLEILCYY